MHNFIERKKCPSCHSQELSTRFVADFASPAIGDFIRKSYKQDPLQIKGTDFHLSECQSCGLMFQKFIGDDEFLSEFYSTWVWDTNDPERDAPGYQFDLDNFMESRDAHELMTVASFLEKPLVGLNTLDYGMGLALWARIAKKCGANSYGFDLSPLREDYARKHGVETLTEAEIQGIEFDFINTEQLFEHVSDPLGLARTLSNGLRPGGILKISVPSADSIEKTIAELKTARVAEDLPSIMPVWPLEHVNAFRTRSIQRLADLCGLTIVRPSYRQRYAFARYRGGASLRHPAKSVKEIVRPFYQYRNPRNLYVWLQNRR